MGQYNQHNNRSQKHTSAITMSLHLIVIILKWKEKKTCIRVVSTNFDTKDLAKVSWLGFRKI